MSKCRSNLVFVKNFTNTTDTFMDSCMDFGFHLQRNLFPRRIGIDTKPVHVEIVEEKVALLQVSLGVLGFSPASITTLLVHIHSSIIDDGYVLLRGWLKNMMNYVSSSCKFCSICNGNLTLKGDRIESYVKFQNCSALKDRKFSVKSFPLIENLPFFFSPRLRALL